MRAPGRGRALTEGSRPAWNPLWSGIVTIAAVSAIAVWVGRLLPSLGPAVIGMILGLLMRNAFGVGATMGQVTQFCTKSLLKVSIVLLGATFTLRQAASIGWEYLPIILTTIGITLVAAYLAGRFLGVPRNLASLIGSGTSICGATAILTVAPVVGAKDEEVTYAVSTIFIFNLIAMVTYPLIGHLMAMAEPAFGAWAGTAIHDTSSVLAAAFGYGHDAGRVATVVKLTRTLFLIPLLAAFAGVAARQTMKEGRIGLKASLKAFPTFVIGFVAMAVLASIGVISEPVGDMAGKVGRLLITVVLVAVGLSSDLVRLRRLGLRPLLIGLVTSVVVASVSIALLAAKGGAI